MIGFLIFFFGVITALGMCGLAAWTDFKGYRIPNIVSLVIVVAFLAAFAMTTFTGQNEIIFTSWKSHLGSFIVVLLVTMAMFGLKIMGAGDSKMATAVALWLGWEGMLPFLFYMAMTGGLLAVASVVLKKYKPLRMPLSAPWAGSWLESAQAGTNKVPYGIAIATGALIAFIFLGYFDPEKWLKMVNL